MRSRANPRLTVTVLREDEYVAQSSSLRARSASRDRVWDRRDHGAGRGRSVRSTPCIRRSPRARPRSRRCVRSAGFSLRWSSLQCWSNRCCLALVGAVIGARLAWLFFSGAAVSTLAGELGFSGRLLAAAYRWRLRRRGYSSRAPWILRRPAAGGEERAPSRSCTPCRRG